MNDTNDVVIQSSDVLDALDRAIKAYDSWDGVTDTSELCQHLGEALVHIRSLVYLDTTEMELLAAYEAAGESGVANWVHKNRPSWAWTDCVDCGSDVPVWPTVSNAGTPLNLCAVCWSQIDR